jgi:hypothetical protein
MSGEGNRGEKRTGPALNPLKGSSARLPHCLYYCIPEAKTNSFVFIFLSLDGRVKMLYPRENLPGRFPPVPRALLAVRFLDSVLYLSPGRQDHLCARIVSGPNHPFDPLGSFRPILDPVEFSLLL